MIYDFISGIEAIRCIRNIKTTRVSELLYLHFRTNKASITPKMVKTSDYVDIQFDIPALAFLKNCEQELWQKLIPFSKCRNLVFLIVTSFFFMVPVFQSIGHILKTKF